MLSKVILTLTWPLLSLPAARTKRESSLAGWRRLAWEGGGGRGGKERAGSGGQTDGRTGIGILEGGKKARKFSPLHPE